MSKTDKQAEKAKVIMPPEKPQSAMNPGEGFKNPGVVMAPAPKNLGPQNYRVEKLSFINGTMVQPGQIVQLPDGVTPGKFLKPVGPATQVAAPSKERVENARVASGSQAGTRPVHERDIEALRTGAGQHVGKEEKDEIDPI